MGERSIRPPARRLSRLLLCVLVATLLSETQAAGLSLSLGGSQIKQEIFSLFAVPGEILSLDLTDYDTSKLHIRFEGVEIQPPAAGTWRFSAPQAPGLALSPPGTHNSSSRIPSRVRPEGSFLRDILVALECICSCMYRVSFAHET